MSETMIIFAIASFVALAIGAGAFAFMGAASGAKSNKRLAAVAAGRTGRPGKGEAVTDNNAQRRKNVQDTLKELERKQAQNKARVTVKQKMEQAGWTMTPMTFFIGSGVMGVLTGAALFVLGYSPLVALASAFAAGVGLPRWILGLAVSRRKKAFTKEFANAIDVIVRGVKAGLPLPECLKVIANEAAEPVGPEFRELVESQKVGVTLEEGLRKMYERMPISEVNFFQIVLSIQAKTGGNLSEALGNLANVLRERKRLHGKIQALSSEAKASAMIIGSLPIVVMLLVYVTTPSYIALLFTEKLGNLMLLGCVFWMSIGIFVMRGMINFKY